MSVEYMYIGNVFVAIMKTHPSPEEFSLYNDQVVIQLLHMACVLCSQKALRNFS